MKKPNFAWLSDPQVFRVNRIDAHSDHRFYLDEKSALNLEEMELVRSLNGKWKFCYAKNTASVPQGFYEPGYAVENWDDITVPGHIQLAGYDKCQYINTMYPWDGHSQLRPPQVDPEYNPCGCYVRRFTVPDLFQGKKLYISFQGVETAFYLWCNGTFIGYSEDSFTPADFEIGPFVKAGENTVSVLVCKRSTGSWLEDQDFWRFSGIFRDVFLYATPKTHMKDLFVKTELAEDFSSANVTLELQTEQPQGAFAQITLYDELGIKIYSADKIALAENTQYTFTVNAPKLWCAELPVLYKLLIKVANEEGSIEYVAEKIGFRRFTIQDGIMQINGKRIVFRGINRHEFNCRTGRAVSMEDMLWDARFIKQNNINAVRTSHYPNQTQWYRICDEYGIYLIDETNLESHGSWQKMGEVKPDWVVPGDRADWKDIVLDRAASMLERDKNHPSILIWSCGNESFGGSNLFAMSQFFRRRDPSRLVHYEGVFHDRRYDTTSDMESRMYAKPQQIEDYLRQSPQKPFISCEYMHAMGNSLGGMDQYTELADKYLQYQGGFIWDYIDQALVKQTENKEILAYGGDFGERPTDYNFCTDGILYADRTYSPKVQEMKQLYASICLTPDKNGVCIRNKNLFADTSHGVFCWVLTKDGNPLQNGDFSCIVPAEKEVYTLIKYAKPQQPGEYVLTVSFCLKEASLWAPKGLELAFGQYVYTVKGNMQQSVQGNFRVVHGDINTGVHGDNFSVLFSRQEKGIVSLRYDGKEFITRPPKPVYWRASTDNDRGCKFEYESACWQFADRTQLCTDMTVQEKKDSITITYAYRPLSVSTCKATVVYTVYPDGGIAVRACYSGAKGLPDLPLFGMGITIPKEYDRIVFYGMGPDENYIDRKNGARLGLYKYTAAENLSRYVVPQECGNRTGVRFAQVQDKNGFGLRFEALDQPFEFSALHYTAQELENAWHIEDLPAPNFVHVRIAARQMGVGGDDSWGAPVYPKYKNKANAQQHVSFKIKKCGGL